jgi:hypothetical protein
MVMKEGRRIVVPMRYQCRLAGKPSFYDTKFPGTYNAPHAVMVANAFFENVSRINR